MNSVEDLVESQDTPWKTEGAYWTWVRGGLRSGLWNKHPVKLAYIKFARERVPLGSKTKKNPTGMVWGGVCETCGNQFRENQLQVDHIERAGKSHLKEDLEGFIFRMINVTFSDLALICKPCHTTKSHAERYGMTYEEALIAKKVIASTKKSTAEQIKELTALGYTASMTSNAKKRKECYEDYYKEN